MKAAFLQFNPAYLDVAGNVDRVAHLVTSADADLIVLPEFFTSGYFFQSTADAEQVAEPIPDGPTTQQLAAWAQETGATIVAGLAERAGDRLFNSAVVVGPDGYVGTYRKVHLYYEEKLHFTPGDLGFPVFEMTTRTGRTGTAYRLGVMICFDWYFPESARSLALNGADVIAHPSNLVLPHCPRAMPIRAIENHVFTITANRTGEESKPRASGEPEVLRFIGQSEICAPDGQILLQAGRDEERVGIAELDPEAARDRQLNAHNHLFADRRPQVYAQADAPERSVDGSL